jgi:peptidoglycan hydrolase-like protein with peptidoglycan-binding domain
MRAALLIAVAPLLAAMPAGAQTVPPPNPPALTYTQALAPQAVQMVQGDLHRQGVYDGRIDGVWGPDSQAALERFQQTHGLQVTGQLNQATIATLGISPDQLLTATAPAAPAAAVAPIAGSALSQTAISTIQSRLRELNFYRGATDGIWGAETQAAIERFQQGRGLQPNGQLNPATITALGINPNILAP